MAWRSRILERPAPRHRAGVDGAVSTRQTRAGDDEEPELDEDELLAEEGLKDDRLEARLALAYDVATAGVSSGREHPMKAPEFRKAVE